MAVTKPVGFQVDGRPIGIGQPTYVIAEMSANHGGDLGRAREIVHAAKEAGADAVKLQTYTADTLTIRSDAEPFQIRSGPWRGQTLYDLYHSATTPWEWQPLLKQEAGSAGITLFSTPFDNSSVHFLEEMGVPAYKIASCELIDLPLIKRLAQTGKPLIMSTGRATLGEIEDAVQMARSAGGHEIALLKCTSSYPAPPAEMNLNTIPHMQATFGCPVGLSDHSLGIAAAVAAVSLGACIVEKHFTLDRTVETPDSFFSLDPKEFRELVYNIRLVDQALGDVWYEPLPDTKRRSLYAIEPVRSGDTFTEANVQSRRPGGGIGPQSWELVRGRRARNDIKKGTMLTWDLILS